MKEIRDILRFWETHHQEPLALATLVAAQGSSYRRPGARMLISPAGHSAGGVSAGCIEAEVIASALQVIRSSTPRLLTFDTRLRFGCSGTIHILVEPAAPHLLAALHQSLAHRQPCRLQTIWHGDAPRTQIAESDTDPAAFVQTLQPPIRLILIGDSSDTDALHAHATLLGWEILHYPAPPVPLEQLDARTAIVLATHNYGRDCAALRQLLPTAPPYLGLIGSRRRRDDLLFDVLHHGATIHEGLYAPAGLHLGAETPEEIALSIVAEIQCVFASGTAQHLRHRAAPIHPLPPPALLPCIESAA